MDAIILVGGLGTRLRPLTARRHKSLLPVGDKRAFDYLLEWVAASGIERAVLALGRDNEDLADAYSGGHHGSLPLAVVTEQEPLQSGGAIRFAFSEAQVEGRFLALNGDTFMEFAFAEMLEAHIASDAELSIALHEEDDVSEFGVAEIDERSFVTNFAEKSARPPSRLVNAGAWIFEPHLIDEIPGAVRVEDTLFPQLVESGRPVLGHCFEGLWADIGTPARYLALVMALVDRGTGALHPGLSLGTGAAITRSAAGPGCALGPGALVHSSILWEDVRIGSGARIENSVVADSVTIGDGATLDRCVVGPGATVLPGAAVPVGESIAAGRTFGGHDA